MRAFASIFFVLLSCANGSSDPAKQEIEKWSEEQLRNNPFLNPKKIPSEKELGSRAHAHVAKIVGFGPRISGSKARKQAADYIVSELKSYGLEPLREAWLDPKEKIRFENIRVLFAGKKRVVKQRAVKRRRLLFSTHYDTKREIARTDPDDKKVFLGANDGGSGAGLLLALAKDMADLGPLPYEIEFVWFDGEESLDIAWNGAKRALFGSKEYVRRHIKKKRSTEQPPTEEKDHPYKAMILLDMVGHRNLAIDRDMASDQELVPPIRNAAKALGYEKYFFAKETDVDDDHVPFMAAGLPCLNLIQFENNDEWHTSADDMKIISARSLAIVGRVIWRSIPALDRLRLAANT